MCTTISKLQQQGSILATSAEQALYVYMDKRGFVNGVSYDAT